MVSSKLSGVLRNDNANTQNSRSFTHTLIQITGSWQEIKRWYLYNLLIAFTQYELKPPSQYRALF